MTSDINLFINTFFDITVPAYTLSHILLTEISSD